MIKQNIKDLTEWESFIKGLLIPVSRIRYGQIEPPESYPCVVVAHVFEGSNFKDHVDYELVYPNDFNQAINSLTVFYGENEYTSNISERELAIGYVTPELFPLIVNVVEHGGWSMVYYFDQTYTEGICVGTANDMARFSDKQMRIRDIIFKSKMVQLPTIRREPLQLVYKG